MSIVFEEVVADVEPPPAPNEPGRTPGLPPSDRDKERMILRADLELFARRAARLHAD